MKRRMRRANIFLPGSHIEDATIGLARLGKLHVDETHQGEWQERPAPWQELTEQYDDLRTRCEELFSHLDLERPLGAVHPAAGPTEQVDQVSTAIEEAEREIVPWQEALGDTEERIDRLDLLMRELETLAPLDVPMEDVRNPAFEHWIVGTMSRESLARLNVVLYRIPAVIVPVHIQHERALVVGATSRDHGELLERAMRGVFLEPLELPDDVEGVPSEAMAKAREQLEQTRQRRAELVEQGSSLRQMWRHRLSGIYQTIEDNARLVRAITRFDRHRDIYLISGWIPGDDVQDLLVALESATGGEADVQLADARRSAPHVPPSSMHNPRFLRPFETIVTIFGFPRYGEIDPTPLVAITFTLMYGMMFGDLGHGALVALAGVVLRSRLRGMGKAIGSVLAVSGLVSMVFGVLYGSVFGREDILPSLWLSPLTGITTLLVTSVLAGIVLLNLGFLAHLISAVRARNWSAFLIESSGLAGMAFYWALVGGGYALVRGSIGVGLFLVLLLVPALLLFLKEPLVRLTRGEKPLVEEGWGAYSIRAFFEVFETLLSNASNTLSFVRLGAFAVAHAGLMRAVFALAGSSGPVGSGLIIVIGTVLVIVLEGVIVGIQALRLEYYEFFGKFFSGGGVPFRPFTLSGSGEQ